MGDNGGFNGGGKILGLISEGSKMFRTIFIVVFSNQKCPINGFKFKKKLKYFLTKLRCIFRQNP